ncbi:MAG: FAD-dependent oxidoreductase [Deltaproteobacteria bacterium]|nr:FAD-dependent oxidoreductase [Deltaproteobacteria bacterium]
MKYVIIGNSYAGLSCGSAIRRFDKTGEVTIISDENYRAYARPLISYYLEGKTTDETIWYKDDDYYEKNGFKLILGKKVVSVDTAAKKVVIEDGTKIDYDKLFVGSGGTPFVPPTEGFNPESLMMGTFTRFDDAKKIKNAAKMAKNKEAIVVGGGLIGLKASEGLRALGLHVTIVELLPRVLGLALDEISGNITAKRLNENGIDTATGETVTKINLNESGNPTSVILKSGKELIADIVVVGVGVRPNVGFLEGSGVKIDRGIIVDKTMMTSVKDVYAGGDAVVIYDVINKRPNIIAIVPLACEEGRVAGTNMAGIYREYSGGMGLNSVEIYGLPIVTIGLTNPADDSQKVYMFQDDEKIYRKLVYDGEVLVGAILLGDIAGSGILSAIIRQGLKCLKYKDEFLNGNIYSFVIDNEFEIYNINEGYAIRGDFEDLPEFSRTNWR